jgi:hypothetical protein
MGRSSARALMRGERPSQVTWFHRMASPGREDELVRGPFIRAVADDPHFGLPAQHISDNADQRKLPATGSCLHMPEPKPTTGTHELLANPDDTVPRVHIPPAKP